MIETAIAHQLAFVVNQRNADETDIIAEALREGIHVLYTEALTKAYLQGQITREVAIQELGIHDVVVIDATRNAIDQDIAWGLQRD